MRLREPIHAVRALGRAIGDAWDGMFTIAVLNLCWLGLSATIVLAPPASAALFETMDQLAQGRTPGLRDLLAAVRRHLVGGWLWALWGGAGLTLTALVITFYGAQSGALAVVGPLALVLAVMFAVSLLYVWPLVLVSGDGSLGRALRNSLLVVFAAPLFALTIGVMLSLLLAISVLLVAPIAFFTPALIALVASHAVRDRLVAFGKLPRPSDA
ncbi:hypothetical protein BH23CHL7_BH23CHL7_20030 [soil metagenome]